MSFADITPDELERIGWARRRCWLGVLVVVHLVVSASTSGCSEPAASVLPPGEYAIDYEATIRAIEAESGRLMTEDERRRLSGSVGILGPWVTFNADGTFAWDNRPDRVLATGPNGVKVGTPLGWVGGSGTYMIRNGDELVLNYEEVSDSDLAALVRPWYPEDLPVEEWEAICGGIPGLHVTLFGECHLHGIQGQFIRWRYGRNCAKFILLRLGASERR